MVILSSVMIRKDCFMIILGVDYGDARTGLSFCDRSEMLASPLCVIPERNTERLIKKIAEKAAEIKAELIVVGLPKNMDASVGERGQKCIEFAASLSEKTGLPHVMRDERLSTVSAHVALNNTNTRGKKRKAVVDAVAAVMILQDYIDYRRNQNGSED